VCGEVWLCVRVRVVLRERMTSEASEQARRAERGAMQENQAGEREGMNERVHAYAAWTDPVQCQFQRAVASV
jgi:hypothetical protein